MVRRLCFGLAFATIVGWMDAGCSQPPGHPPPAEATDAELHVTGSVGAGGGGEAGATTNACAAAGGLCMTQGTGNICPEQTLDSCGTAGPGDDSGEAVMVCCTGFNNVGLPDATPDVIDN